MKKKTTKEAPRESTDDLPLFYAPLFRSTALLPPDESKHAARVLRLPEGAPILVTDGKGSLCSARIAGVREGEIALTDLIEMPAHTASLPPLHIAIAPTKNSDRTEWLIEKMVEVGLAKITLLYTERTVRRHVNIARLEKVMISALKQSRKRFVTEIAESPSVEALLREHAEKAYIGYCGDEFPKKAIREAFVPGKPSLFLIGPEGDFTPDEVRTALDLGATAVTLGEERLRTETAGLYAGILHTVLNS